MEQTELFDILRGDATAVPFVGAGLAIPAGVPSVAQLASRLAESAGVLRGGLDEVSEAATASVGLGETQRLVAQIVGARKPSPDPKLIKLAQWPAGRILTTNYDEAIEVAIRATGRHAIPVGYKDTEALTPRLDAVKVIHLHGHINDHESIILPGKTTEALAEEEEFLTQVRAMMEPGPVLYLGFSFAPTEIHLRGILRWLRRIRHPRRHLLVLPRDGLAEREADLAELRAVDEVSIVSYDRDPTHSFVGKVAAIHAFRPDSTGSNAQRLEVPEPELFVYPALVREEEDDGTEDLQGRVWGAEQGWSDPFINPFDLANHGQAVVVATPGMGKTEMLNYLARHVTEYKSLVISSRVLAAQLVGGEDTEIVRLRAVTMAIAAGRAGVGDTPVPDFDALGESAYLFLLDDFDQGGVSGREAAARAVITARTRWPQHRWVIAGRPCEEVELLTAGGFERFRIFPSELWGQKYIQARGISPERLQWLTTEQTGFSGMIGIPLFATEAANRLLDDEDLPTTPLELIIGAQRQAVRTEAARRHGSSGVDLDLWLRRLAVGLELRHRLEASVAELASVPGHGDLGAPQIREEMVRASLLTDSSENAAFARRTLQEGLCAAAILETEEPAETLRTIAIAEIARESHFRSDMDFTIDLVFESAMREVRPALRALDERRWALTVTVSGSQREGGEALDLLLGEADQRGQRLSRYAHGLRAPVQAVVAIVRAWPALVYERRARLLEQLDSEQPYRRFNALWTLAAQREDSDPSWLSQMIEDQDGQTRLSAARAAAAWGAKETLPAFEVAVGIGELQIRKRILQAFLDLVDEPADILRVIASQLNDSRLVAETAAEIDARVDLDGYLTLLETRTHNSHIWEWLLERALQIAGEDDWTDSRVERLVAAVIIHDGDPQTARDQRLVGVVEAHIEVALSTAHVVLSQRPSVFRGLAMFSDIPQAEISGPQNAPLREAASRAVSKEELDGWRRPERLDWQALALSRLEEPDGDAGSVLDPEIRWPIDEMTDPQIARLTEVTEANLPSLERDLDLDLHSQDEADRLALGALNAAAQLELPLERDRWMRLIRSPNALRTTNSVLGWLTAKYLSDYDREIERYASEVGDADALSVMIAALPREAERPRQAIAKRLDGFITDVDGWSNAAGMLSEPEDIALLTRLRNGRRTDNQLAALRQRLARMGEVRAQIECLDLMITSMGEGGAADDPLLWRSPVEDSRVLGRLGDLLEALGAEAEGPRTWSFAVGLLSNSPNAIAVSVIDRVSSALGTGAMFDAREALVRRLAADRVRERLPQTIAGAAMVLEPGEPRGAESKLMRRRIDRVLDALLSPFRSGGIGD